LLTTRFLAFDLKVGRLTCFPVFGPIFAGKFQFSGMCDSGRWTRKDHEEIKVYGGADCLHPAAGWQVNPKRIYRLYREMGLQLRNKTPKRRVKAKLREDRQSATLGLRWNWVLEMSGISLVLIRVQAARLALRVPAAVPDWLKFKNPAAPTLRREAEEDWGKGRWR
jgi:hypothetical protein